VALTLKLAGAFSVDEIAAAFLAEPGTIAQRIVRAKRTLASIDEVVELADAGDVAGRLDSVLEALYLLFNEGYDAHAGPQLVRPELCNEAIRLMRLIANDARTALPHAHALLALMLFQASRLPARVDADGELVLLPEQDRALWDGALIAEAFHHFDQSTTGDRLSSWHVQAAIAAAYASAPSWEAIDWGLVLMLHDQLLDIEPTPVVALNRAIALSHVEGPAAGRAAALPLLEHPAMRRYFLLPATLAAEAPAAFADERNTKYLYQMAYDRKAGRARKAELIRRRPRLE
jgi:RNA polymerase sigma-70 factor (ECF subfamily)